MNKRCGTCRQLKPYSDFCKTVRNADGLARRCRSCNANARSKHIAKRGVSAIKDYYRAYYRVHLAKAKARRKQQYAANMDKAKLQAAIWVAKNKGRSLAAKRRHKIQKAMAVPKWADHEKIKVVYDKAKQYGFEVDHIVPLQSPKVCGLHVWENLQLLDKLHNVRKRNLEWPDMP